MKGQIYVDIDLNEMMAEDREYYSDQELRQLDPGEFPGNLIEEANDRFGDAVYDLLYRKWHANFGSEFIYLFDREPSRGRRPLAIMHIDEFSDFWFDDLFLLAFDEEADGRDPMSLSAFFSYAAITLEDGIIARVYVERDDIPVAVFAPVTWDVLDRFFDVGRAISEGLPHLVSSLVLRARSGDKLPDIKNIVDDPLPMSLARKIGLYSTDPEAREAVIEALLSKDYKRSYSKVKQAYKKLLQDPDNRRVLEAFEKAVRGLFSNVR